MSNILFDANRACRECKLRNDCKGPVPGEGPMGAKLALVGEAPGYNEDKLGLPFRGAAGEYLVSLLRSIGLKREDIWITNTTKCRPLNNRTPTAEEVEFCASRWLDIELQILKPEVIVPMGDAAISHFLGEGTVYERHGVPAVMDTPGLILPIYHPAAGLHRVELMTTIQEDFMALKEVLDGTWKPMVDQHPVTDYQEIVTDGFFEGQRPMALDTETIDGKIWSVQVSSSPGIATFARAGDGFDIDAKEVVVHNYLYDAQFVDLPPMTRDTMEMAYLLGLPQGLKELAKRFCGMEMDSYTELVRPYGKEKAMAWLERAALGNGPQISPLTPADAEVSWVDWPDPPVLEDFTWNKKTNTLGIKQKTPQHISKKIKRILADVRGGKENKDGPVDPFARWHKIDERERHDVEAVLGPMPEGNLEDAPREDAVHYSGRDADATLRLDGELWPIILSKGMQGVFQMDMGTYPVALEMMKNGIKIDPQKLQRLSAEYGAQMQIQAEEIFETACLPAHPTQPSPLWRFNPNSDNELRVLFFERLGFKPTKFTKTGLPSVAGPELAKIDHPLVKMVENYRHLQHLKDSFCDTLPEKADGNNRIHPTIKTTRTATGRWSMADPNCQQIPTRTDLGRAIRTAFVPEEGNVFVAIDYSQIELRMAAHLSQCQSMMQAFRDGRDIHTETAARLFGVMEPTEKQRYAAKTLNFGVIYGITADGFQAQMEVEGLGWSVKECEAFIKESNSLRPELWVWQEETKAFARRNGYVVDMFGRRRLIPEILCPVKWIQSSGEREAINMPVQSGAQGILKRAMKALWEQHLVRLGYGWESPGLMTRFLWWLLQIHDELLWEIPIDRVADFIHWAIPIMQDVVQLSVPVIAEAKTGPNWGEMTKWTA